MSEVVISGSQITVTIGTSGGGGVTDAQLATKVDKVAGKGLSTEDYTTAEKNKLATVEENAKDDQTGAEIKTAYENEADTNAFTDDEKTKLSGIEAEAKDDQTGAEIKAAYENEADTNAFNDADKAKVDNLPADIGIYISASLGAFIPTAIAVVQAGTYDNYTQTGDLNFSKSGTLTEGLEQQVRITSNGTNVFNFNDDFGDLYGITDGGTLAAGAWWFYFKVIQGKIHVSVPGVSPIDVSAATLSSTVIATTNPNMATLTFTDAVNITIAGWSIASDIGGAISFTAVEAGDGTTTPDLTLSRKVVEGETLTISYSGGATTKVSNGEALATITNVAVTNSVTAPAISSVVVAGDNSTVTVNISVGGFANDNGTGDLLVADFVPSIAGGVATSPVLSNPVHTAGGTAVVFDLSYTGEADGNETLTITVASGASVFDQYGNAMQAGESGADGLNSDAPVYEAESSALFARMATAGQEPDATRKSHIDTLIAGLKTDGNWAEMDLFVVLPAHAQAVRAFNWTKNDHNGTEVGAPTFAANTQISLNGSSQYVNSDFKPTDGVNLLQNDCTVACYAGTNGGAGGNVKVLFSVNQNVTAPLSSIEVYQNDTTNVLGYRVNRHGAHKQYAEADGLFDDNSVYSLKRTASNVSGLYKNGVLLDSDTEASVAPSGMDIYFGASNQENVGAVITLAVGIYAYWAGSSAIDDTQVKSRLDTFFTAIGA